jgi:UDP-N-acetylglucosamine--N-acetylmuramyl-(pentapeptide) pyrophosphoryl-undecaprenol N-acetylglucosamine transferase
VPDSTAHETSMAAAIACGGTGGHLFPGLAVGEELRRRGCAVTLMVSPKNVDQQAIGAIKGMEIVTLPAVAMSRAGLAGFLRGFCQSYQVAARHFARCRPQFVLAMGGFISAAPVVAGKRYGARTYLHDSNSIPGRANRWLARLVDGAFVYFPPAARQLRARRVEVTGMPVRPQFLRPMTPEDARRALELNPEQPVLLVMGGSQGATKINQWVLDIVPQLRDAIPNLQFIHFTGTIDFEKVRAFYQERRIPAFVRSFFDAMGTALAAADVALSRAGASSLAEMAARQLPSVLVPYPTAADNHQFFNARAFVQSGAARMLRQETASPGQLARELTDLLCDPLKRSAMQRALAAWRTPEAAAEIAAKLMNWEVPVKNYDCLRAAL